MIVVKKIGSSPIVSANGFISRDLFEVCDRPTNFYMIGSMGLSSSIGLGIALKNPKKKVYVFDGDGNVLMNLGSLTTIGTLRPMNLVHIVFDNEIHESTGGQPTNSSHIQIERIAKTVNYVVFKTNSKIGLEKIIKKIRNMSGPIFVLVKIKRTHQASKRVNLETTKIKKRFMDAL